jgi:hypothetical protein
MATDYWQVDKDGLRVRHPSGLEPLPDLEDGIVLEADIHPCVGNRKQRSLARIQMDAETAYELWRQLDQAGASKLAATLALQKKERELERRLQEYNTRLDNEASEMYDVEEERIRAELGLPKKSNEDEDEDEEDARRSGAWPAPD